MIAFWDARHGLIGSAPCYDPGCGGSIFATSDGGLSFRVILRTRRRVVRLQTAGRDGAIAELDGGTALRTFDRGRTWRAIREPFPTSYATSTVALGVRSRVADRRSVLDVATTRDAGSSWRYRRSPCPNSVSQTGLVDLVTERLGWLVCLGQPGMGNQGKALYRTVDGGRTWSALARQSLLPAPGDRGAISSYGYPIAIAFATDGFGLICESRGTLFMTRDAGTPGQQSQTLSSPKRARPTAQPRSRTARRSSSCVAPTPASAPKDG